MRSILRSVAFATASLSALLARPVAAQTVAQAGPGVTREVGAPAVRATVPSSTTASAVRAAKAPALDGRDDDEVWSRAKEVTGFRTFDPTEDGEPLYPTTAKVAYDERNLYVFVRMFDSHPDSLKKLLSRRDVRTVSDQIKVMLDSYHDRRTGYEFAVNPAGVKRDYYMYNDGNEDPSWDGVWDAVTTVDSLGWTAEFRIPLSQVRYADKPDHTFGIMIWRDRAATGERSSWPAYHRKQAGLVSQFGEVGGFAGLASPHRLEVVPYTVAKNESRVTDGGYGRTQKLTLGADVKYGLSSNLTLDATVNPDFGQVEADPSVLNLTAFETYQSERRPFFLEGTGIFSFDLNCNDGDCTGLFYSRRIGRSPQLRDSYGGAGTPLSTTILGAAKLTGRTGRGTSVGVLDAVTQREVGLNDATVEPATNFAVARVQQDLRGGKSGVGLMATGVTRNLDSWTTASLRRQAFSGGLDFRHRFAADAYELSGYAVASQVLGDTAAINRTQLNSTHGYQRPDAGLPYDATRTSLVGDGEQIGLQKVSGAVHAGLFLQRFSPGFEINDLGFLPRADQQSQSLWVGIQKSEPFGVFRRANLNFNQWQSFTAGGMRTDLGGNVNANWTFRNLWNGYLGVGARQRGGSMNDRDARGGPAFRRNPGANVFAGINTDARWRLQPEIHGSYFRGDEGRSTFADISPSLRFRAGSQLEMGVGPGVEYRHDDSQWYDNVGGTSAARGAGTHYLFAHLDQTTYSAQARLDYTATRTLSLQVYASPFMARGVFSNVRELDDARSPDYERRFVKYVPLSGGQPKEVVPATFNFKQFRSNTVLRWEYRPGSTLFFVWGQNRDASDDATARDGVRRDARDLFRRRPDNTFLVKASYWFSL